MSQDVQFRRALAAAQHEAARLGLELCMKPPPEVILAMRRAACVGALNTDPLQDILVDIGHSRDADRAAGVGESDLTDLTWRDSLIRWLAELGVEVPQTIYVNQSAGWQWPEPEMRTHRGHVGMPVVALPTPGFNTQPPQEKRTQPDLSEAPANMGSPTQTTSTQETA